MAAADAPAVLAGQAGLSKEPAARRLSEPHVPEHSRSHSWGRGFDPDRLALLELRMWKAYYRGQPARLFALLVRAVREQANASLPRAALAAVFLTKAAAGFARATGDYGRFAPDVARGYRLLGLPREVDVAEVARHELAWWVVRREMGLAAGEAAVADAGRLRGLAAEVRDRGATADRDGPTGQGDAYWPLVARLLRESYRRLSIAVDRRQGWASSP